MVTLQDINLFASSHNLDSNTDVFKILSMIQLGKKEVVITTPSVPSASKTEYSVQDVLDLFST